MAAGDVTCEIIDLPLNEGDIETAVASMRTGANDKWLMTQADNQLIVINIEEA